MRACEPERRGLHWLHWHGQHAGLVSTEATLKAGSKTTSLREKAEKMASNDSLKMYVICVLRITSSHA